MSVSLGRQAWHDQRVSFSPRPFWQRLLRTIACTTALLALLTACSLRLDTPPSETPTPGPTQSAREDLAGGTAELAAQARSAAAGASDTVAQELAAIAEASEAHLEALGGLWTPPPRPGTPSPSAAGSSGAASDTASPQDVVETLADMTATDDLLTEPAWPAETATLIASITVYRHGALLRLRHDLGQAGGEPPEVPDLPEHLDGQADELCRTLDGLGYAYEVRAARTGGQQREQALTRARHYRGAAQRVAEAAGVSHTNSDPRRVSYDLNDDLAETIVTWQAELLPAWLALIDPADPEVRTVLLAHAQQAAARIPLSADTAFPGLHQD